MTGQRFQNLTGAIQSATTRPEITAALSVLAGAIAAGQSIHAGPDAAAPLAATTTADGQWLFCQTAGSTGAPKTIRRRPQSWITSFEVNRDLFELGALDSYAVLGHLGHSLTLYALCEALHLGAGAHVLTGLSPRAQRREMTERGITVLYATPAQLRLLVDAAGAKPLPALRLILSGGGKLDPATHVALRGFCPNAEIREFFGASETSFVTISAAATPAGSVGKPYPGVILELRDAAGQAADEGELWLRSPYVFDGYAAGDARDTRSDSGWLTIGEMARADRSGNITLLGRKSRMVTVADCNVYPEAVEAILAAAAPDRSAAVLPAPDARRGHHLVAFVTGPEDLRLAKAMTEAVRAALGPHATPRSLHFLPALPMLAAGKPDLIALAHLLGPAA